MKTELVKAQDYGIEEKQEQELLGNLPQIKKERDILETQYSEVIKLDVESPDSLMDKDLREPMTEQFGVKYGPTVLLIEDGEIVDMIEWTPLSADDKTAIPLETIETFFENSGYLE